MLNNEEDNKLEMLDGVEENPYAGKTSDIKQVVFQHLNNDNTLNNSNLNNNSINMVNDVNVNKLKSRVKDKKEKKSKEVVKTEKQVKVKKVGVPAGFVIFLLLIVNVVWYCAVHFFLIPDYENYKKNNNEIRERIDYLDGLLKAIVGE